MSVSLISPEFISEHSSDNPELVRDVEAKLSGIFTEAEESGKVIELPHSRLVLGVSDSGSHIAVVEVPRDAADPDSKPTYGILELLNGFQLEEVPEAKSVQESGLSDTLNSPAVGQLAMYGFTTSPTKGDIFKPGHTLGPKIWVDEDKLLSPAPAGTPRRHRP